MKTRFQTLQTSKAARFFNSFSSGAQAALLLAIPFTLIDSLHYYTAGTAIVFSLPLLFLFYFGCGFLAAKLEIQQGRGDYRKAVKEGFCSGVRLWFFSTLINTLVSFFAGMLSLGVTILLGIPYLLLCAPVLLVAGAAISAFGAYVYTFFHRRIHSPIP